jgi:plastocyanin
MVPLAGIAFIGSPAANAGGSCHSDATAKASTSVSLSELCFGPTVTYVASGGQVTWTNADQLDHTVTGLGFRWGSNGDLRPGQSVTVRFDRAGVYPYACILHPGMVGSVVVGDAGSPTAIGLAAPVTLPSTAPPSAPASPQHAAAAPSPVIDRFGPWRAISIVSLALLAASLVALGLLVASRRRSRVPIVG